MKIGITKSLRGGLKMKMTDEAKLLYLGDKLKSRRVGLGMNRMDLDKKTDVYYQHIKV